MALLLLAQAQKLDSQLEDAKISSPSFDADTLDQLPRELQDDCRALASSADQLKRLARGPSLNLIDLSMNARATSFLKPLYISI